MESPLASPAMCVCARDFGPEVQHHMSAPVLEVLRESATLAEALCRLDPMSSVTKYLEIVDAIDPELSPAVVADFFSGPAPLNKTMQMDVKFETPAHACLMYCFEGIY